jgi:hypothetical protein
MVQVGNEWAGNGIRFATHHQQYEGDECCVEMLMTPCEHNQWIFEGVS